MYLSRSVYDKSSESYIELHLKAKDENFTIPIYCAVLESYLLVNVYSFEVLDNKNIQVAPFTGFYDNKMVLFCNDLQDLDLERIAYEWAMYSKVGLFNKFDYRDNFDQYKINNKTYRIFWNLSKDPYVTFKDKQNQLEIGYDGKISRYEAMTNILKDQYCEELLNFVKKQYSVMGLADKIASVSFDDIVNGKQINGKYIRGFKCDGIMGVCSQLKDRTYKSLYEFDSPYKCNIVYSPHIVYQSLQTQKFLIIHELCHAKIGYTHGHDRLFWYMFEHYNKMDRNIDWAYSAEQEKGDDAIFERCTGLSIESLTNVYKETYPLDKTMQTVKNYDWFGSYSGLNDTERQFTVKKYKRNIIDCAKAIGELLSKVEYVEIQDVIIRLFQWNKMASRLIEAFEKEDQIIIEDITNCFCKIYISIEDNWANKKELCKIQIQKINQLIDVLGDPIEVENPENILNEAKLRRDIFYQKFIKKHSDVANSDDNEAGNKPEEQIKKGVKYESKKGVRSLKRKN